MDPGHPGPRVEGEEGEKGESRGREARREGATTAVSSVSTCRQKRGLVPGMGGVMKWWKDERAERVEGGSGSISLSSLTPGEDYRG